MDKKIKAIETRYKGYRFRSRLEARFAIIFDHMGLSWDYEPEGFELPECGRYLPDFFVKYPEDSSQAKKWPGAGYWIEVKGGLPTKKETLKCLELQKETGHNVWFFYNGIGHDSRACEAATYYREEILKEGAAGDFKGLINGVVDLMEIGKRLIRSKDAGELCFAAPIFMVTEVDDIDCFYSALGLARSARFEHGETP